MGQFYRKYTTRGFTNYYGIYYIMTLYLFTPFSCILSKYYNYYIYIY